MIDWNIVLYIGMVLIVFGFGLFLYSEMKIREIDRKIAENDRFINAILRAKKWVNIAKVQNAILTIHQTGNVDQKETKEIRLELLELMHMAIKTFAH